MMSPEELSKLQAFERGHIESMQVENLLSRLTISAYEKTTPDHLKMLLMHAVEELRRTRRSLAWHESGQPDRRKTNR